MLQTRWIGRTTAIVICALVLILFWAPPAKAQSPWAPGVSYAVGALVTYNGATYRCLQAHTSEVGWEPATTPALWQLVSSGGGGTCKAAPGVPTGLAAAGTTSSGTTLSWKAVAPPTGCSITGYTVYQNGASIGTASGTSFSVSGLAASTAYTFSVAASDSDGSSTPSAVIHVTTPAGGGGGGGGSCPPVWNTSTAYNGGATASLNGIKYTANYWTQGASPDRFNGPAGSGEPWTSNGSCTGGGGGGTSCKAVPGAPTGLAASGTTSSSTNLKWTAPAAPANCTISGYTVYQNGVIIGTSAGASFSVIGLAASTTYSFAVSASDSDGASALSAALKVTTTGGGGGGGGGGGSKRFAPYADISLASGENIVANAKAAGLKGITLAFLVDGGCVATWGGLGGSVANATFPNGTSVASAVNGLTAEGIAVIISWGGALGSVQSSCGSAGAVQAMYQSVFNAYPGIAGQDFDIEGGINNTVVGQALAGLKKANPGKAISLTLPVLPTGLVSAGLDIVNACHSAGFHPDSVNVMAMDYGSFNDNGGNMLLSAEQAAAATHSQTGDNIGITPMIGVNDTSTEVFKLSDASGLVSFAKSNGYINRLAFWSLGRDNGGCAGLGYASSTCSGVSQSTYQFSSIFGGF